jgi:AraC family transcriptional regulator
MFNASDLATRAVSAPDRSPRCPRNQAIVQLLAAAIANFDSDSAKPCIQRAAELLAASGNRHGHRPNEFSASPNGLAPWKAKRVAEYVEANIASKLWAPKLAGVVRLSTAHFVRAFKKSFGETPLAYVTRRRICRALVIMLRSREPLSTIAVECGMCDQPHFTRVFRRTIGISPGMWRRQFTTLGASGDGEKRP